MAGAGLSPLANCCQGTLPRLYRFKLPRQDLPGVWWLRNHLSVQGEGGFDPWARKLS